MSNKVDNLDDNYRRNDAKTEQYAKAYIDPYEKHLAVIKQMESMAKSPTSKIISDLINDHIFQSQFYKLLYDEYRGKLPIEEKTIAFDPDNNKPNNKMINDYRGEITKQHFSYSFGNPITYVNDESRYNATEYEKVDMAMTDFNAMNKMRSLDMKTAKFMGICGTSSRLLYVDVDKNLRAQHVSPWETIFIRDKAIDEVVYAMRYFPMKVYYGDEQLETRYYVEWYDREKVYYFQETKKKDFAPVAGSNGKSEEYHNFKSVPLIEFKNNDERLGDFNLVRALIDGYDHTVSCSQDEIDQFRNAYLIFENLGVDTDTLNKLRAQGALSIGEGGKVYWLVKEINDQFFENHKKTLQENVYKFSGTVDMSDEKFSGAGQSGESRKWKLKSIVDRAIIKQGQFEESIYDQYECIQTYWNLIGIPFNVLNLSIGFTPNIPVDSKYEAETSNILKGLVSEKTRLSRLSFIADPDEEIRAMEDEQELIQIPDDDDDKTDGDDEGNE